MCLKEWVVLERFFVDHRKGSRSNHLFEFSQICAFSKQSTTCSCLKKKNMNIKKKHSEDPLISSVLLLGGISFLNLKSGKDHILKALK